MRKLIEKKGKMKGQKERKREPTQNNISLPPGKLDRSPARGERVCQEGEAVQAIMTLFLLRVNPENSFLPVGFFRKYSIGTTGRRDEIGCQENLFMRRLFSPDSGDFQASREAIYSSK